MSEMPEMPEVSEVPEVSESTTEPQKKITEDNKVFYGNMCFVCEKTVKEVPLKKCGSCKLISYCGEAHQRSHWKHHSRLCKLIKEIEGFWKPEKVDDDGSWYKYRTNLLMLCEVKLERKLRPYEVNMILFPNNCDICHKQTNVKPCLSCLCVNYCSEEHKQAGFNKHRILCSAYTLCYQLDLKLEKTLNFPCYQIRKNLFNLTENIERFIGENIEIVGEEYTPTMRMALISDFFSCPLTVLYALTLTTFHYKEKMVIHVIGSSYLETASLESWKTILHVHPRVHHLSIIFIGPEVCRNTIKNMCEMCQDKIKFYFFSKFYHEYVRSTDYVKPDVIVSFNCGFHEYQHTSGDTWKQSLPLMIKDDKIPVIFTSFTEKEARDDSILLLEARRHLKIRISKNKFASRRPYRDLENSGIYYNNQYLGLIHSKLHTF